VSGLVEVARFGSPMAAELARAFLESYGLEAIVFDANSFGNSEGAMITVRLMVVDEELEEAREALREYRP
jgi:hypothetical protein